MTVLSGLGLKLLAGLAIAGAVVAILLGAKHAGHTAEKVEQFKRNSEVRRRQDVIKKPDPDNVNAILDRL